MKTFTGHRSAPLSRSRGQESDSSRRQGFTLVEMLVASAVATVMALSVCSLMITSTRTWQQEMRQNEMNMRGRQLVSSLVLDVPMAANVVFVGGTVNSSADQSTYTALGTCAYTPPSGVTMTYPSSLPSYSRTGIPAADRLVVVQTPSYDSTGVIPGAYDYVGYGWVSASPGQMYRTCIPNSLSSRKSFYGLIPGGGTYDASVQFTFHIATTAPTSPSPLSSSYPGTLYNPFATTGSTVVPAGARLQDVDSISVTGNVSGASWGAAGLGTTLSTTYKLRNWRQS